MTSPSLDNLVRIGKLKKEPPDQREFAGLLSSARTRLNDAGKASNGFASRFDLAYSAAHAISLAALRWHGYRCDSRYLVFQVLPHTTGSDDTQWRVLALCHDKRNAFEYHGTLDADEKLLAALIEVSNGLLKAVEKLGPVK